MSLQGDFNRLSFNLSMRHFKELIIIGSYGLLAFSICLAILFFKVCRKEFFKADIIQNKQYPLFYMLNTHRNPSYMHWKSVGNTTLEDFDYLHTYNNNEVGCVFESVAFNTKLDGGTRKTLSKRKNKTRKQLRTKTICPFIFKKTSFGMPIMYLKHK
jgi:hypothetical protein